MSGLRHKQIVFEVESTIKWSGMHCATHCSTVIFIYEGVLMNMTEKRKAGGPRGSDWSWSAWWMCHTNF